MSGRPRRACDKCSSQKLRCSGQRPSCQRCLRLRRPCVYSTAQVKQPNRDSPGRKSTPIMSSPRSSSQGVPISAAIPEKAYVGVPSALIPGLLDVYFSHIYNATLLLHRPSFLEAVAADTVRGDILLSVCAFAAKFYRDPNDHLSLLENGFAYEWAERAGRLAFQEAESPREENIVSFINLALFWYSEGEFRRSNMHEGTAVQTARVLGLSVDRHGREDSLEAEMRRRRYWATYLISSFQSESAIPKTPSEAAMKLSLPCRDEDFELGFPRDRTSLKSSQRNGSVYAELIRAMTLWSAVHMLVKQPEPNDASRLAAIQTLDGRIHEWWSKFPLTLQLTPTNFSSISSTALPRLLLIHTVYHQCLCALHSSIVPLFSWSASDDSCLYARQISGQTALDHANALSALFDTALHYPWDPSRMPSFIGYAAYCACAIQMPFMWCRKPEIKHKAHANVLTNLKTIHLMGKYWKFIALLGANVRLLYEYHLKHLCPIPDEPKNMDATAMDGFKPRAARARVSILTHNQILWAQEGGVARRTEDVDLGLEDENPSPSHIDREGRIADFISEISREGQDINTGVPIMMDPFPSYLDFGVYDPGLTFVPLNDQMDANQVGSIEDWIGELMQEQF